MEAKGPLPSTAGLARPPHLGSCRALWHALDGGAHSQRPSGSCGPRLGSPPRLTKLQLLRGLGPPRRPNGAGEGAHKVRPHDGADAQPLYQQGRGCGAGLAAQRQSFLGCTSVATRCLTDMFLLIVGSGNSNLPVSQAINLGYVLSSFFLLLRPASPPATCQPNLLALPAECLQNPTTSPHLRSAHPVQANLCSACLHHCLQPRPLPAVLCTSRSRGKSEDITAPDS